MSFDLTPNIAALGTDLLTSLRSDLLGHLTDPAEIDLASRNTAKITAAGLAMVGATPEVMAQAQEDYNSGMTVLLSLASAAVEDQAAARADAQAKLWAFVQNFLATELTAAIRAIPLAAI